MNHSCFARIRKSGTFRKPGSSKFCSPWIVASGETGPSPQPMSLGGRTVGQARDYCQKRTPRPRGRDRSPRRFRDCEEAQPSRPRLAKPQWLQFTASTRGHAGEGAAWPGRRTWAAAPTSAVRLEAPPADELELVVLVMGARGAGAGRIDIAEVGFREVPAEGEREGARRPPETNLRLPVVDAEEGRAGRIGDKTAAHDRPIVVERGLEAPGPAKTERVGDEEHRVDPGADALSRRKSAVLVEDHAAVEVRVGDPTTDAGPHGPTLQLERHGPALLVEADSVQDQRAVGDLIGEVAVLEVHRSIEVRRRGAAIEPFPSLAPGHARVKRR